MNAEIEKTLRRAENDLEEINRHLENKKVTSDPQKHHMLIDARDKATNTINTLKEMQSKGMYSSTNIGYSADNRLPVRFNNANNATNNAYNENDAYSAMRSTMDAISRILPQITQDYDAYEDYQNEAEARQGVPGTGRYANPRLRRRGGRQGIGTRRAAMDNYSADDAYNDAYNDARSDMNDAVARAAADAAAATARQMANEMRGAAPSIYPGTPVMMRSDYNDARNDYRSDANYNMRSDARMDTRSDMRSDADTNYSRSDDATSDRSNRAGPVMNNR